MAQTVQLAAEARSDKGKGAARRLRETGKLPAVLYGRGLEPQSLAIGRHEFIRILHAHGAHPLVLLSVDGSEHLALVKQIQVDAVKQAALHVDFQGVDANRTVQSLVPVHVIGTAAGQKMGGIIEIQTRELSIEALPLAIPEAIEFDVSSMEIGDVARVSDVAAPEGVKVLTDPEETLVTVAQPKVASETPATSEEAEEAGAPEAAAPSEES